MKQSRNTQQRKLIRDLLDNNYDHLTADEIYEIIRKKNPTISRGTVYRNLNVLSDSGEIRKLTMPTGPDHYDCMRENHYHFLCSECNCVLDVDLEYNSTLNEVTPPGCKTEYHSLVLIGLCPKCNCENKF